MNKHSTSLSTVLGHKLAIWIDLARRIQRRTPIWIVIQQDRLNAILLGCVDFISPKHPAVPAQTNLAAQINSSLV